MIHGSAPALQVSSWQLALQNAFQHPLDLLEYLGIDPQQLSPQPLLDSAFRMRVPRSYADRMRPGDPNDPLLRQVLPVEAERRPRQGFVADPVSDLTQAPLPGLLHKYHGRALLIVTGACAVNCRYCFRRHYPYGNQSAGGVQLEPAIDYLSRRVEISEVILSGGDPLMLPDNRLSALIERLAAIPHLQRLRIHTRLPVMLQERITPGLIRCMTRSGLQPVMVLHINHPREIDARLKQALDPLARAGVTLLNQAVLLRGVNDDADTLCELSEALFTLTVLPYYLHLLDRVEGAAHFEVAVARALDIHREIRSRLPGYLVPRMVREEPGHPSKTPLL